MTSQLSRRQLVAAASLGAAAALVPAGPATASTAATAGTRTRRSAALVVHNARVLTGARTSGRPADAVAVGRDGRVLATGTSSAVRRFAGRDTDYVDARGATVMSGIVDGHAHPLGAAERTLNPSLQHASFTVPQLQEILGGFLAESAAEEPDGWLLAEDWNPIGLLPTGTVPHHSLLDALPTRRPVALIGNDGHNMWVNRRALDIAGITAATPDPPGGEIVRAADGTPTGLLKDDAQGLVRRHIPGPDEARLLAACARTLQQAAAMGITSFLDALVTPSSLDTYAALSRSGRLLQRIAPALRLETEQVKNPTEALAYVRELRARHREVAGLHFGVAKVFLDGVIEYPAQTAALLRPYLDEQGRPTDNRGDLYATSAEFGRLATVFDRAGWQLHAHAIGDRAVRTALDGYETALRANGRRGNRHTVAHLQLVHPDDHARFRRLDVVACMQLQWATRNTWTMEALAPYLGPDRHRLLYPARSLERRGAALAGGSDWPVDPLNSWNQIRTAVDREGADSEQGALYPEREALSRASALRMHTAGSAHQLRLDRLTGSLTPGLAADLVVLDRDVTRVPVREISDTRVRLTLIGGQRAYDADATDTTGATATRTAAVPAAENRTASLTTVHGSRHRHCGCGRA